MYNRTDRFYSLIPRLEKAGDESDLLGAEYQRVCTGFSFVLKLIDQRCCVSVHRGFLTNGNSLPFLARKLLEKWLGLDHPAVVLHDWLSEYLLIESNYVGKQITLSEATEIFILALEMTKLTSGQITWIQLICDYRNLWKSPYSTRLNPYKRYVEDKSYGICN